MLGVIALINCKNKTKFTDKDAFILQTIADFSGVAIVNAELYEKILTLTYFDPLTGAYNRAKFQEMQKRWGHKTLKRKQANTTVVAMIDLNHFKELNDTLGHAAGDQALHDIVVRLNNLIRDDDMLFRMGGDEFLIVLRHLNQENAKAAKIRLEANLETLLKDETLPCTFAYGLAKGSLSDMKTLTERADKRMYQHKKKHKM